MSERRAVDDSSTFGRDDLSSSNEMDVRAADGFLVWADNDGLPQEIRRRATAPRFGSVRLTPAEGVGIK